jgi:hypothetical protein
MAQMGEDLSLAMSAAPMPTIKQIQAGNQSDGVSSTSSKPPACWGDREM